MADNPHFKPLEIDFEHWEDKEYPLEVKRFIKSIEKYFNTTVSESNKKLLIKALNKGIPHASVHYSVSGSCDKLDSTLITCSSPIITGILQLDAFVATIDIEAFAVTGVYRTYPCERPEWIEYDRAMHRYYLDKKRWTESLRKASQSTEDGEVYIPQDFPPEPIPPGQPSTSRHGKTKIRLFPIKWYGKCEIGGQQVRILLYEEIQIVRTKCC